MKKVVSLSLTKNLKIEVLAALVGIADDRIVKSILELKINEHFMLFGTEPYSIEYDHKTSGYLIKANSTVGFIDCDSFILEIKPKHNGLEIGKCLQLAHSAAVIDLVKHSNTVCETRLDDNLDLQGVDYFAMALISSVQDCITGGLVTSFSEISQSDPLLRGKLDIAKHVQMGGNPVKPMVIKSVRSINNTINSVLKSALLKCSIHAISDDIKALCSSYLVEFKDVADNLNSTISDMDLISSIPRPDYKKALTLAEVILNGFSSQKGNDESFSPFFTIDLDVLFEKYCTFQIKKTMNQDTFSVQSQKQISHPFTPAIDSKHICPDIIITRLHSGTDNKSIVVDTKNKFSFTESGSLIVSNADIYQTYYYAKLLNTNVAILLYPGDSETHTSYPIKGSDGEAAFARKMTNKMHELLSSGRDIFKMTLNEQDFYFVIWRIDLSGTLQHTAHSVAQLCQFISDVSQRKVLN